MVKILNLALFLFCVQETIADALTNDNSIFQIVQRHELMIRSLQEKVDAQEKEIKFLKKTCVNRVNEVDNAQFSFNDKFRSDNDNTKDAEDGMSDKHQVNDIAENIETSENSRQNRIIPPTSTSDVVAFYAYMGQHEPNPGVHQTIIYDVVKTNVGGAYNGYSGIFTAKVHGVYIFTWTTECDGNRAVHSELLINSVPHGVTAADSSQELEFRMVTGVVAAELNAGDVVHVRIQSITGGIYSSTDARTSFCGWKL